MNELIWTGLIAFAVLIVIGVVDYKKDAKRSGGESAVLKGPARESSEVVESKPKPPKKRSVQKKTGKRS